MKRIKRYIRMCCKRKVFKASGGGSIDSNYYVSEDGTGNGFSPASPMSPENFLLVTLSDGDNVFFNKGNEF